ncbi:LapA family protein [uncultured Psychrosphaera sp.]|uniref:LapA family protein n=1 Tax=uncultured Psychrosphaera sp. TaxID=1403522 RepID=UPI003417CE33
MKVLSYIFLIILIIIALALGSENGQLVSVNLLFVKLEISLAVVIYSAFIFGLLSALIMFLLKKLKPNA